MLTEEYFKQERVAVSYETKEELRKMMDRFHSKATWEILNETGYISFYRRQMINEKTGTIFTTSFHVSPQRTTFQGYTFITAQEFFILTGDDSIVKLLTINWSDTDMNK